MRLLPFYIGHTFVNSIKKLFKTWVAVFLIVILLCGVIGGIVGVTVGSLTEDETQTEETQAQPADPERVQEILEIAITAVVLLMLLFNFYTSEKSGTSIFTMSDVNFLFSAPMKPQSVLMFRVLLQMGLILIGSLYLVFQLPNLILNAGLPAIAAVMLLVAWIMTAMLGKMVAVCTYTLSATHDRLRSYIRPVTYVIVLAVIAAFGALVLAGGNTPWQAAVKLFGSGIPKYIPVFGWMKGLVIYAAQGNWGLSLLCLGGLVAVCALFGVAIGKIKADFYEDALAGAAEKQAKAEAAKDGRQSSRKRSEKLRRGEIGRGEGANMFFVKSVYNRSRFAKGGILTKTFGTYMLLCIAGAIVMRFVVQSSDITVFSLIILVVVFFRNYGNPLANETSLQFIYLVPEKASSKLMYAMLAGTYDTVLDLVPAFVIFCAVVGAAPLEALVWVLLFITLDFFASATGLFIEMVIPESVVPAIRAMMQMLLKILAVFPGIVILALGAIWGYFIYAILICCGINVVIGLILFAFCPRLLHRGR